VSGRIGHRQPVAERGPGRALPPSPRGQAATHQPGLAALQYQAGNAAVGRLLLRTSASGTLQRKNVFWGPPESSVKTNPLATIAAGLQADAKVPGNDTVAHWRKDTNLKVAKTAKTALTTPSMESVTRPDKASAWLDTPNPNPGTRKDPSWITTYGNLGTVEDQIVGETPQKYNGGHLIAWEFLNEAANVQGNIAPQAMIQNQALYRRIERTLDETIAKGGTGLEVTVTTPYRHDHATVTYRQLFERKVLTSASIRAAVESAGVLDKAIAIDQMAPDTYDLYVLTHTGVTHPVKADAREEREGVKTYALPDYSEAVANRILIDQKPPPLSILATNVDAKTLQQTAVAFAHVVYLNYRTTASPIDDVRAPVTDDEDLEKRRLLAIRVVQKNQPLAVVILEALRWQCGLSPTEAELALVTALMDSEPPEPEPMRG
jgi:hypothetical protein